MEKGLIINDVTEIDNIQDDIRFIYYGSEFCVKKFLRQDKYHSVYQECQGKKKQLSILTPIIPENYFSLVIERIKKMDTYTGNIEIVVNDLGLLNYLNKMFPDRFIITLGRLLNRAKKAPSIMNYFEKLNLETQEALQTSSINSVLDFDILRNNHVTNIQYDNIVQKNCLTKANYFGKHLMYPYVQISTARKCLSSCISEDTLFINGICNQSCDNSSYLLYNNIIKRNVTLYGNTILYENNELPDNIMKFDRIIYNGTYCLQPQFEERRSFCEI